MQVYKRTFDLITANTPISEKSSNFLVFRLQPVYFYLQLSKSIYCWYSFEWIGLGAQLYAHPTGDEEIGGWTPVMFATIFRRALSWNIFCDHSLPSADSRKAVGSLLRKNVHNTGQPLREQALPSKRVVRITDCARHDPIGLTGSETNTNKLFELNGGSSNEYQLYMLLSK